MYMYRPTDMPIWLFLIIGFGWSESAFESGATMTSSRAKSATESKDYPVEETAFSIDDGTIVDVNELGVTGLESVRSIQSTSSNISSSGQSRRIRSLSFVEFVQEDDGRLFDANTLQSELLYPWSKNICLPDSGATTTQTTSDSDTTTVPPTTNWFFRLISMDIDCDRSLTGLFGTFHTPNYPRLYPKLSVCLWFITVPRGYTISLTFDDFDMEAETGLFKRCHFDYLEVFDNYTISGSLGRYCGNRNNLNFNSTSNVMTVAFTSDISVEGFGFSASYRAVQSMLELGETMTSLTPSWPIVPWSEYLSDSDSQVTCVERFHNRSSRAVHLLLGKLCLSRSSIQNHWRCRMGLIHGCTPVQALRTDPERQMLQLVRRTLREQCRLDCHLVARRQCGVEVVQRTLELLLSIQNPGLEDCLDILRGDSFKCLMEDTTVCKGAPWVTWFGGVVNDLSNKTKIMCQLLQNSAESQRSRISNRQATERVECEAQTMRECFTTGFSQATVDALFHGSTSQIYTFWKKNFQTSLNCLDSQTGYCSSNYIRKKKELVKRYAAELVPKLLCGATEAYECVWRLNEAIRLQNLDNSCRLLEITTRCIEESLDNCTSLDDRKNVTEFFDKVKTALNHQCDPVVKCLTTSPLRLEEGGPPGTVEFEMMKNRQHICHPHSSNCKVFIDFYVENSDSPNCPNGRPMRQFGVHSNSSDSKPSGACSIEITDNNWHQRHSVNLAAIFDYMRDGTQRRRFLIILRRVRKAGGRHYLIDRRTACTQKVDVIDNDSYSSCMVVTDPQIFTFDNRYYVSLNTGHFYLLYQHSSLAYEVHAAFHTCNNLVGSCACAVAVRVHDSVFYVDVCKQRHSKFNCGNRWASSTNCRESPRRGYGNSVRGRSQQLHRKVIYHHYDKTKPPGFRLHQRGDSDFEVFLPHGGKVLIRDRGPSLNIYIRASPVDRNKTRGLCGSYDGNPLNDLTLRNGLLHDETNSFSLLWDRIRYYPEFVENWRVDINDWLTDGAPVSTSDYFSQYGMVCDCQKPLTSTTELTDGAPTALCHHNGTLEMCHNSGYDVTDPDHMPTVKPQQSPGGATARGKRETTASEPYTLATISSGNWTFEKALEYCEKTLITDSPTTKFCSDLESFKSTLNVTACAVDIMLTGSTEFEEGMMEALKQKCDVELQANDTFSQTEEGREAAIVLRNHLCRPACNNDTGECENGQCKCTAGFAGSDCSLRPSRVPRDVWLTEDGLCDRWRTSCSRAIVNADIFVNTERLTCHLQAVLIDESSTKLINISTSRISGVYLHRQMVACPLPPVDLMANKASDKVPLATEASPDRRAIIGYLISISNDEIQFTEQQIFVPHDSRCHTCSLDALNRTSATCIFKENVCITESGLCLEAEESSPIDPCLVCRPRRSQFQLSASRVGSCGGDSDLPLLILMIMFSVILVVVIAIVAVVIVSKKSFGNVAKKFNFSSNAPLVSGSSSFDGTANGRTVSTLNLLESDSIALADISSADQVSQAHVNKALALDHNA